MPTLQENNQAFQRKFNRRNFLQTGAVLAGGMTLLPLLSHGETIGFSGAEDTSFWYQKPLLILQTVLREPDAKNYDAKAVVQYMKKTGCNTLVINAGGIVDFFQNPLPAANINPYMGNRDILKEITEACHTEGIRVIGRIDFRGAEERVYKQFPDWFSVDADQKPIQLDYTRPRLYASCYTGQHRNEYAEEFIHYIMGNYALDGIWHNSIAVGGICHCQRCQESFNAASGKAIPIMASASESDLEQYMDWKTQVADQYMERMKRAVKSFGEDKIYSAEVWGIFDVGGQIHAGIDLYNARDHFDFLVSVAFLTENATHIHYEDLNYANTSIKFLKSMAPGKEAVILYGGNGTAHRLVIDPSIDLKIWLWEILAAGGRFWNCYFTGPYPAETYDRRNAYNHQDAYSFVKTHEKLLEQHAPVANIGIYYSRPTRLFYREKTEEGESFDAAIKGMETVLTESHIPYDFIPDNPIISKERLQKYKVVILPNVRCMGEKEIQVLKEYVAEGGSLVATYATSLYNIHGVEQQDYGMAELFGVHYTGKKVNTAKDNYQFILDKKHPVVVEDSPHTELFLNAGYTLLNKPAGDANVICTLVPTVHNQPPEKAWVEKWSVEFPTVVQKNYGKGKVIYFSNQPDVISHEMGHPDIRNLLSRSIRHLAGNTLAIESNAPESVHIGLTKSLGKPGQYILSFVNTTSGPTRPIRRLIPVHDIQVKLRLDGKSVGNYKVLRSQGNCKVKTKGRELDLQLSKLEDFCAVHIQMNT
ncbi:alpha-amylase family protein [Pontibacter harenae]|uniref:alpha-amylase family protein n=1 Tax=Pontibacter harenae TaxID=2894083 RepID=UPI001E37E9A4|nr:alpha-amylase family protein [Pontibacter harenae]MCC9167587.1 beta-galactosidase trimerization domain-containing protein [Pontibacter harenae]